jgi:hypothetical protein
MTPIKIDMYFTCLVFKFLQNLLIYLPGKGKRIVSWELYFSEWISVLIVCALMLSKLLIYIVLMKIKYKVFACFYENTFTVISKSFLKLSLRSLLGFQKAVYNSKHCYEICLWYWESYRKSPKMCISWRIFPASSELWKLDIQYLTSDHWV